MTPRSDRDDRGDRGDTLARDRNPIARPGASGTVELRPGGRPFRLRPRTAMEMSVPWKSQNDFHRPLEISHRTRDSHISTADPRCVTRTTKDTNTGAGTLDTCRQIAR